MTFISYAQNFEDIRRWRALKFFENGFYIDVGANEPTADSVTKAFYERGWSGINIEPVQVYHDALCRERPRDINLQCVAGENAADLTFYAIADTGLSTVEPAVAKQHLDAGMDVSRWRPMIILIETPWARDQTWEHLLTDAGYQSVLFDGLNTFYLAEEHLHFKGAFDLAPCNLDEFQFCYGHKFSHPVSDLENALHSQRQRAETAEAELHALRNSRTWRTLEKLKKVLHRA